MGGRAAVAVALGAVFLAGSGCGPVAPPEASGSLDRVRVTMLPYLRYAPLGIALEEGYFREEGLEIETVPINLTAGNVAALVDGTVDVGAIVLSVGLFNAVARGAPVRVVADRGSASPGRPAAEGVVLRRDLLDEAGELLAASPAGLRISARGSTYEEYVVERMIAPWGLSLDALDLVDVPGSAEAVALSRRSLDGVVTSEPLLHEIERRGYGRVWRSNESAVPGLNTAVLLYGRRLIESDREVGRRFMVAYLRGVRRFMEGPTEENLRFVARFCDLDLATLPGIRWPEVSRDGRIDPGPIEGFQRWALGRGLLDRVVEPGEYWDDEFGEHAVRRLAAGGVGGVEEVVWASDSAR